MKARYHLLGPRSTLEQAERVVSTYAKHSSADYAKSCESYSLSKLPRFDTTKPFWMGIAILAPSPPLHYFLRSDTYNRDTCSNHRLIDEATVKRPGSWIHFEYD